MRSRSNGGVIGAYALPTQNGANGVFFIHDAAIFNTGANPIWPLASGYITSATGGTITTAADNANYKLHTFTANGTFTVATGSAEVQVLLVGGGGAGGYASGVLDSFVCGGGGGGAVVLATTWANPGTVFTVEVGAGGVSAATSSNSAPSKVTSTAGHSYIAYGGGFGAGYAQAGRGDLYRAQSGGSGGGGGKIGSTSTVFSDAGTAITTNNNIAYAGGTAGTNVSGNYAYLIGGGGGGAGEAGHSYNDSVTASRGYGANGYYWARSNYTYAAGGGGGRAGSNASKALGGLQGPGTGSQSTSAGFGAGGWTNSTTSVNAGTSSTNYGSGGGGSMANASNSSGTAYGGAGAQGIVIFAYRYR